MVKWCFLKILIRKNKQLFTIALSYGTSSVTVKNGQYLDKPASPEQVAHILTAKIHVHLLTVKNHTHYFQHNSRDGKKSYLFCGKQDSCNARCHKPCPEHRGVNLKKVKPSEWT